MASQQQNTDGAEGAVSTTDKPMRQLACMECQRRKTKCDHKSPCGNCVRLKMECAYASAQVRRRRRKYPEKVLLDRLRHYESLMRQNDIAFQPMRIVDGDSQSVLDEDGDDLSAGLGPDTRRQTATIPGTLGSPASPESLDAVDLWGAMNQKTAGIKEEEEFRLKSDWEDAGCSADDIAHLPTLQKALDQIYPNQDTKLLFCEPASISLSELVPLHPTPDRIFQLWQVYLDNVDPLLKVTHSPTMQGRVVDAVTNLTAISLPMHAFMFSMYAVAVLSISNTECLKRYGAPKKQLLANYQFGCLQAIWRCNFMRSNDCETLTAVLLYMISIKPDVDQRSLSTLLGTVVRIAQRLGIDSDAQNAKYDAFEVEMRRRLWWALVLFDRQVCQASHDLRLSALNPTWSCQLPANLNDFELRPGMKTLPQAHERPTEALQITTRSTIGQWLRFSTSQMDFVNPMLKSLTQNAVVGAIEESDHLTALEDWITTKLLGNLNLEHPLQFVTWWSARSELARARLWKHYWTVSRQSKRPTDSQRDAAMSHALTVVECEAVLSKSPVAEKYRWYIAHFPFAAYIHVIQELRVRPYQRYTRRAWTVLNDDFMTRFGSIPLHGHPIFVLLAKVFVQAWEAHESGTPSNDRLAALPIIDEMRRIAEPKNPAVNAPFETYDAGTDPLDGFDLQDFLPAPADGQCTGTDWLALDNLYFDEFLGK